MEREMEKVTDRVREGARIVERIGDVYDTASPEGWACALLLLAARALDRARKRARETIGER